MQNHKFVRNVEDLPCRGIPSLGEVEGNLAVRDSEGWPPAPSLGTPLARGRGTPGVGL